MHAAKQFDILLGLDIHLTVVAPGVIAPMPTPFVGIVFDPFAFLPFIGTNVYVHGIPAATAGTMGRPLPMHIPIGLSFGPPPPGNEAEIFMGSATVGVIGEPFARSGVPVLSCHSVGMPPPVRSGKRKSRSFFMPTTQLITLPAGPPVMVGGPLTVNYMALGMNALGAGLGVLARKGRSAFKKVVKKGDDAAEKIVKKGDDLADSATNLARNKASTKKCTKVGHPVDVATGKVFTEAVDFVLPGPIPLRWQRVWYSTSTHHGPVGHGMHHSYDLSLSFASSGQRLKLRLADGRDVFFPALKPGEKAFLVREKLRLQRTGEQYVLTDENDLAHHFSAARVAAGREAKLTAIKRAGAQLTFRYNPRGFLSGIIDSAGRELPVENDALGRIKSISAPHPLRKEESIKLVRYDYDEVGNLAAVRDALNYPFTYEYQGHLLTRETNRNGLSFYFEYDGVDHHAWCIRTWGDGGIHENKLRYDKSGRVTWVTNSRGATTRYTCDENGLVTETLDPLGHTTRMEFDAAAQPFRSYDAINQMTSYIHDAYGNLIEVIYPDRTRVTMEYQQNRLRFATDENGGNWSWNYNGAGQLTERINPLYERTTFKYDGPNLAELTDPNGNVSRLTYDDQYNLTELLGADGTKSAWSYDKLGRTVSSKDAKGLTQTLFLNLRGDVLEAHDPDGNIRKMTYDGEGNATSIVDRQRSVQLEYAGLNRVVARTENGTRVEFKYDTEEDLVGIINEHGYAYRFGRNARGEVTSEAGFDGLTRSYERDPAGRVAAILRPGDRRTDYDFDPRGRTTKVKYYDGSTETYAYRADGELIRAESFDVPGADAGARQGRKAELSSRVTFIRDALGRVVTENSNGVAIHCTYDKLGNRTSINSSLGTDVALDRNKLGDLEGVVASEAQRPGREDWSATFGRDAIGLEIDRTLPGGVTTKTWRDKLGRPLDQSVSVGGYRDYARSYKWGVNDRLRGLSVAGRSGRFKFEHDAVGNLAAATYPDHSQDLRMPDAVGNLFRSSDRRDRYYGKSGQLLRSGTTTFRYDAEGNLTEKKLVDGAAWRYEWNASGMLAAVDRPDGQRVAFTYDALGRRLAKTYAGTRTNWVWDGNVPLHEWTETVDTPKRPKEVWDEFGAGKMAAPPRQSVGPGLTTYLFEPGSFAPLAKFTPEDQFAVITDHLGTPILMYDGEGRQRWSLELDIYGGVHRLEENDGSLHFRYPGQYADEETGLCYNRFRYYDPAEGVYLSQDPIGLAGGNPTLYGYVGDVNGEVDVFGLACSADAAAKGVLPKANALSIKHNREFGGLIYQSNGKYFATPPIPGGKTSFKPSSAKSLLPENAKVVGDYHTHGDYSKAVTGRNGKVSYERTNKAGDSLNSDNWSPADIRAHSNKPAGNTDYLGTPSGNYRKMQNGIDEIFNI